MQLSKYFNSYSKVILFTFTFLYFLLPYILQIIVGDEFYLYSQYQIKTLGFAILFCIALIIFINNITIFTYKHSHIHCLSPDMISVKIVYYINLIYIVLIIIRGIQFRINGISRDILLEMISSQLVPGYGYLLLLASISIIILKRNNYLCWFVAFSFIIDLIYQGKIFSTNAVMVTMFYLDDKRISISFKRLLTVGFVGFSFLFLIFAIRAIASSESVILNVYSLFSEFMGVNATAGWAYDYYISGMPQVLNGFDARLEDFYVKYVGHGLALSPTAYFIGNFGNNCFIVSVLYIIVLGIFYRFSARIIGRFALFILMYNFIHLLRHGPNLFFAKSISHTLFLIILLMLFKNFKTRIR